MCKDCINYKKPKCTLKDVFVARKSNSDCETFVKKG